MGRFTDAIQNNHNPTGAGQGVKHRFSDVIESPAQKKIKEISKQVFKYVNSGQYSRALAYLNAQKSYFNGDQKVEFQNMINAYGEYLLAMEEGDLDRAEAAAKKYPKVLENEAAKFEKAKFLVVFIKEFQPNQLESSKEPKYSCVMEKVGGTWSRIDNLDEFNKITGWDDLVKSLQTIEVNPGKGITFLSPTKDGEKIGNDQVASALFNYSSRLLLNAPQTETLENNRDNYVSKLSPDNHRKESKEILFWTSDLDSALKNKAKKTADNKEHVPAVSGPINFTVQSLKPLKAGDIPYFVYTLNQQKIFLPSQENAKKIGADYVNPTYLTGADIKYLAIIASMGTSPIPCGIINPPFIQEKIKAIGEDKKELKQALGKLIGSYVFKDQTFIGIVKSKSGADEDVRKILEKMNKGEALNSPEVFLLISTLSKAALNEKEMECVSNVLKDYSEASAFTPAEVKILYDYLSDIERDAANALLKELATDDDKKALEREMKRYKEGRLPIEVLHVFMLSRDITASQQSSLKDYKELYDAVSNLKSLNPGGITQKGQKDISDYLTGINDPAKKYTMEDLVKIAKKNNGINQFVVFIKSPKVGQIDGESAVWEADIQEPESVGKPMPFQITKLKLQYAKDKGLYNTYLSLQTDIANLMSQIDKNKTKMDILQKLLNSPSDQDLIAEAKNIEGCDALDAKKPDANKDIISNAMEKLGEDMDNTAGEQAQKLADYRKIISFLIDETIPRDFYLWFVNKHVHKNVVTGFLSYFSENMFGVRGAGMNAYQAYDVLKNADDSLKANLPTWETRGFISLDYGTEGQDISSDALNNIKKVKEAFNFFVSIAEQPADSSVTGVLDARYHGITELNTLTFLEGIKSCFGLDNSDYYSKPEVQLKLLILTLYPQAIDSRTSLSNDEVKKYLSSGINFDKITKSDLEMLKKLLQEGSGLPQAETNKALEYIKLLLDNDKCWKKVKNENTFVLTMGWFTGGWSISGTIGEICKILSTQKKINVGDPAAEKFTKEKFTTFKDFAKYYNIDPTKWEFGKPNIANMEMLPIEALGQYGCQQVTLRMLMPWMIYVGLPVKFARNVGGAVIDTVTGKRNPIDALTPIVSLKSDGSISRLLPQFFLYQNFAPLWYRNMFKAMERGDYGTAMAIFWATNYLTMSGGEYSLWANTLKLVDPSAWRYGLMSLTGSEKLRDVPPEMRGGYLNYLMRKHSQDTWAKAAEYPLNPWYAIKNWLDTTTTDDSAWLKRWSQKGWNLVDKGLNRPYEWLDYFVLRSKSPATSWMKYVLGNHDPYSLVNEFKKNPVTDPLALKPESPEKIKEKAPAQAKKADLTPDKIADEVKGSAEKIVNDQQDKMKELGNLDNKGKWDFWKEYEFEMGTYKNKLHINEEDITKIRALFREAVKVATSKETYISQLMALDLFSSQSSQNVLLNMLTGQGKSIPTLLGAGEEALLNRTPNYILTTDATLVTQLKDDPAIEPLRRAGVDIYYIIGNEGFRIGSDGKEKKVPSIADIYKSAKNNGGIVITSYGDFARDFCTPAVRSEMKTGVGWLEEVDWALVQQAVTNYILSAPGSNDPNTYAVRKQFKQYKDMLLGIKDIYDALKDNEKLLSKDWKLSPEGEEVIKTETGKMKGSNVDANIAVGVINEFIWADKLRFAYMCNEWRAVGTEDPKEFKKKWFKGNIIKEQVNGHKMEAQFNKFKERFNEAVKDLKTMNDLKLFSDQYRLRPADLAFLTQENVPEKDMRFGGMRDAALRLIWGKKLENYSSTFAETTISEIMGFFTKVRGSSGTASEVCSIIKTLYPEFNFKIHDIPTFVPEKELTEDILFEGNSRARAELISEIVKLAGKESLYNGVDTRLKIIDRTSRDDMKIQKLRAEFFAELNEALVKARITLESTQGHERIELIEQPPLRFFRDKNAEYDYWVSEAKKTFKEGRLHILTAHNKTEVDALSKRLKNSGVTVLTYTSDMDSQENINKVLKEVERLTLEHKGVVLISDRTYRGLDILVNEKGEYNFKINGKVMPIKTGGARISYVGGPASLADLVQALGRVARAKWAGVKEWGLTFDNFVLLKYKDKLSPEKRKIIDDFERSLDGKTSIELSETSEVYKIIEGCYDSVYEDWTKEICASKEEGKAIAEALKPLNEMMIRSADPYALARYCSAQVADMCFEKLAEQNKGLTADGTELKEQDVNNLKNLLVEVTGLYSRDFELKDLEGMTVSQAKKALAKALYSAVDPKMMQSQTKIITIQALLNNKSSDVFNEIGQGGTPKEKGDIADKSVRKAIQELFKGVFYSYQSSNGVSQSIKGIIKRVKPTVKVTENMEPEELMKGAGIEDVRINEKALVDIKAKEAKSLKYAGINAIYVDDGAELTSRNLKEIERMLDGEILSGVDKQRALIVLQDGVYVAKMTKEGWYVEGSTYASRKLGRVVKGIKNSQGKAWTLARRHDLMQKIRNARTPEAVFDWNGAGKLKEASLKKAHSELKTLLAGTEIEGKLDAANKVISGEMTREEWFRKYSPETLSKAGQFMFEGKGKGAKFIPRGKETPYQIFGGQTEAIAKYNGGDVDMLAAKMKNQEHIGIPGSLAIDMIKNSSVKGYLDVAKMQALPTAGGALFLGAGMNIVKTYVSELVAGEKDPYFWNHPFENVGRAFDVAPYSVVQGFGDKIIVENGVTGLFKARQVMPLQGFNKTEWRSFDKAGFIKYHAAYAPFLYASGALYSYYDAKLRYEPLLTSANPHERELGRELKNAYYRKEGAINVLYEAGPIVGDLFGLGFVSRLGISMGAIQIGRWWGAADHMKDEKDLSARYKPYIDKWNQDFQEGKVTISKEEREEIYDAGKNAELTNKNYIVYQETFNDVTKYVGTKVVVDKILVKGASKVGLTGVSTVAKSVSSVLWVPFAIGYGSAGITMISDRIENVSSFEKQLRDGMFDSYVADGDFVEKMLWFFGFKSAFSKYTIEPECYAAMANAMMAEQIDIEANWKYYLEPFQQAMEMVGGQNIITKDFVCEYYKGEGDWKKIWKAIDETFNQVNEKRQDTMQKAVPRYLELLKLLGKGDVKKGLEKLMPFLDLVYTSFGNKIIKNQNESRISLLTEIGNKGEIAYEKYVLGKYKTNSFVNYYPDFVFNKSVEVVKKSKELTDEQKKIEIAKLAENKNIMRADILASGKTNAKDYLTFSILREDKDFVAYAGGDLAKLSTEDIMKNFEGFLGSKSFGNGIIASAKKLHEDVISGLRNQKGDNKVEISLRETVQIFQGHYIMLDVKASSLPGYVKNAYDGFDEYINKARKLEEYGVSFMGVSEDAIFGSDVLDKLVNALEAAKKFYGPHNRAQKSVLLNKNEIILVYKEDDGKIWGVKFPTDGIGKQTSILINKEIKERLLFIGGTKSSDAKGSGLDDPYSIANTYSTVRTGSNAGTINITPINIVPNGYIAGNIIK